MRVAQLTVAVGCCLVMSGCSNIQRGFSNFFFPPNPYSDRRDGEIVTLEILNAKARKIIETEKEGIPKKPKVSEGDKAAPAVGPAALAMADTALAEVQKFLKAEAERYSASYSAVVVDDIFYDGWERGAKINLQAVKVRRELKGKKSTEMGAELCMVIQPTLDQSAFRIFPLYAQVYRAKAKLIAFDWLAPFGFDLLAPWTAFSGDTRGFDNDVDLKIEVSLHGVWVDAKPEFHNQLLAKQELKFGNISLSRDTGGGTFMLRPKEGHEKQANSAKEHFACDKLGIKNGQLVIKQDEQNSLIVSDHFDFPASNAQLFQAVPRSTYNLDGLLGTGNYVISVLVSEYDNYGERVKEISSKVDDQKENILKKVGSLFE